MSNQLVKNNLLLSYFNKKRKRLKEMEFNAVEELKIIVADIEDKVPTDLVDYFDEKVEFLTNNKIHDKIHVGETDWTHKKAAEWLLGMFIGIVEKGKENKLYYNSFGQWLTHVYHFVIDNKSNLK